MPELTRERTQESMTELPVVCGFVITRVIERWWKVVAKAVGCHVSKIIGQIQSARRIHLPSVCLRPATEVTNNVSLIQTGNRFWATEQLIN